MSTFETEPWTDRSSGRLMRLSCTVAWARATVHETPLPLPLLGLGKPPLDIVCPPLEVI